MSAIPPEPIPSNPARIGDSVPVLTAHPDDEVGLFDLLVTVMHHWPVVIVGAVLGLVVGAGYVQMAPRQFAFTTTIEIGSLGQGGATSDVESPETVMAKLNNAYLPVLEHAHALASEDPGFSMGLDVKNPRGTSLVVLTSRAPLTDEAEQTSLHQELSRKIADEHNRKFRFVRTLLDLEEAESRRALVAIAARVEGLTHQRALLQERKTLVTNRLAEVDQTVAQVSQNRATAAKNLTAQGQALTLMMLDVEFSREQDRQENLRRELSLTLEEEGDRLTRAAGDLDRERQDQQGRIAAIQARIQNAAETRIIGHAQRSRKPVGPGSSLIIIGLAAGGILGVLLALMKQAISNHKRGHKGMVVR